MDRTEIILGLICIIAQIFVIPVVLVTVNPMLPHPFTDAELNFLAFAIDFIGVTVIFHRYLLQSLSYALRNLRSTLSACLRGFGLYWLGTIAVNLLVLSLSPDFSNVNDDNIASLTEQNYLLMSVGTVILVPVIEETLYRGVVFGALYNKYPVVAYVVSVLVFSALHIIGYIGYYTPARLLLCFVQYIPAAVFLAWTYVKADTIWAPILIHMNINLVGMLAM